MRLALLALVCAGCASAARHPGKMSRENDGAWVCTFDADRDAAYHAAVGVLADKGYTMIRANPMAGSFTAKSKVKTRVVPMFGNLLRYQLARVDLESAPEGGTRVRLLIVKTREPEGAGRRPNNDRAIDNEALYDDVFTRLARKLES
jgi:hypothetical protein